MNLPDRPTKGDPLKASWGEDVVNYLRALTPQPSPTVKPRMTPGGTTYSAARPGGKGGTGDAFYSEYPWKLYQKPEDTPGLIVNMAPGLVSGINAANSNPLNLSVILAPVTVTDDATTLFWAKVSIELIVWTPYFKVWAVSAAVAQSGAALPSDTLNISTLTDGDVHVQIGSAVAAAGEVTLSQVLFTPLEYNLPPIFYGPETGIHTLVSDEGVIGWAEHEDDWACPTPPEA